MHLSRLTSEQAGAKTIKTRRPLEAVGRSYHCGKCGATKVLVGSVAELVYHTCRSRDGSGWLQTERTLIYGRPV